jgi:hypothetical protein
MSINQSTKRKLRNPIHNPTPEQMNGPKCVIATYNVVQKFKIPSGIDLEDEKQVSDWEVKWSTLTICLTNGKEIEIQPSYDVDMKRPYEQEIEDDESVAEEEGQNCRRCQTFVLDGNEYVLEGDCHAYCENCFKQVEKENSKDDE